MKLTPLWPPSVWTSARHCAARASTSSSPFQWAPLSLSLWTPRGRTKKKPSPSTLRRNARRRNEFLKKKQSEQVSVNEADLQTPEKGRSPGAILDLNLTPVNCEGRVDADSHPSPPSSPSGASIPSSEQEKEDIPEVVLREGDGALVLSKKYSTPPAKVKHPFNGLLSFQWRSGKDGSFYYVGKGTPVKVFNPA